MHLVPFAKRPADHLVSVVISAYRAEPFIRAALESIARQTYANWELIVVEDGSADKTEAIVRQFAREHRGHRVDYSRSEKNQGLGHTRNLTFAKARGEFVAILDADDQWLPTHLEKSVESLTTSGNGVAFSTSLMIEDGTDVVLGIWGPNSGDLKMFPSSLFGRNYITPSAAVVRKQVLDQVGPWDTFEYGEDYSYWMRCIAAGVKFDFVGGCHCLYRKNHPGAMTEKLCNMIEGVANVSEQFMSPPNIDRKLGREYVSNWYAEAARLHIDKGWKHDPSADPFKAPRLLAKAWRFQPRRVSLLTRAAKLAVKARLRRWAHAKTKQNHTARSAA
jgi:glycosyltransferase involved in cell wall biosynthesis